MDRCDRGDVVVHVALVIHGESAAAGGLRNGPEHRRQVDERVARLVLDGVVHDRRRRKQALRALDEEPLALAAVLAGIPPLTAFVERREEEVPA